MTITLLIIIIILLVYSLLRQGKTVGYDPQDIYHPTTAKEALEELRAREILERDYTFEIPSYGMYKGKKIPIREITRSMKEDPAFLSPTAMGKWVKKNKPNGIQ